MAETEPAYEYDREPFLVVHQKGAQGRDAYGGRADVAALECHRLIPRGRDSDTVLIFMHPLGVGHYLPILSSLAKSGAHVIYAGTRYRGSDAGLVMEKCALDLGAVVEHAREKLGYHTVVLCGWSGGGSLSAFFQAEAEDPKVTETPDGRPMNFAAAGLKPADAVILIAAHVSRAGTLTAWLDASITDERDPDQRNEALDLYGAEVAPPYSDAFLDRYRAAQIARNQRITAWALERLQHLERRDGPQADECFTVHGTMADPRWLDPAVDPNDRPPGRCYLGPPKQVNMSPVGLARHCSLRSWLSQWSLDHHQAHGPACLPRVSRPVLVLEHSADDACTPSHAKRLYDAAPPDRRTFKRIEGANHYYFGQPDKAAQGAHACLEWLEGEGLL